MWGGSDRRGFLRLGGGSAAAMALAAARPRNARAEEPFEIDSEHYRLSVVPVATGLEHPWGLAFLPEGGILLTERPGRLRFVDPAGGLDPEPLGNTPIVVAMGQGGLLDVALHPAFAENRLVYLSYAGGAVGGSYTGLARGRLEPGRLADLAEIFQARPAADSLIHYGSRIAFDGAGRLFLSLGERGESERAQRLGWHHGKILRLLEDGQVPLDNPFLGRRGFRPEIWALGVRNPQGLCFDPPTGRLWECEHGPMGGDELNLIEAGRNYGWPVITHGLDYDGSPIGVGTAQEGLEQPVRHWAPSIAPSGLAIYRHPLLPAWEGNLFMGALKAQMLIRLVLDPEGRQVVQEEQLLVERIGRIRAVQVGPDGQLWLLTDENPGALWRIGPVA